MEQNQTERSQQVVQLKNETWRLTLQTFINLVIATMISIVLVLSLSSLMSSVWGKLVTEAVCLAIVLPILYGYMWGQGDRDANFVQFGRMEPDPLKGLRAGALATVPAYLTYIPLALCRAGAMGSFDFMPFFRLLNAPMWGFINLIHSSGAIAHEATEAVEATETTPAIEAMAATEALPWGSFVVLLLLPLLYIAICAVGYYMGTKRLAIMSKLVYKDDKKKPNRRNPQ